MQKEDPADVVD